MPSRYAFVRYVNKDDADKASMEMHGKRYGANIITVEDSTLQNSFFTQDTGIPTSDEDHSFYYVCLTVLNRYT